MKKFLLTLTAVAGLTAASQAQEFGFEKGNFIVEGNLATNNTNDKGTKAKTSVLNFNPKAGYFVTDKIAVGVDFGFGQDKKTTYAGDIKTVATNKNFGVGAFGRYYFLEVGSRFKTYTEVGVGYTNEKLGETKVGDVKTDAVKFNGFGANAGIGANFFLTEKIAVNFAFADVVSFNSRKADVDGAKAETEFNTNVNVFNNFFNTAKFGLTFKF
ncbi:outer membrane protein [Sphingobacterium nematocida]|uniref:Outer membrane protein n=1 Tax=Sphingobacterium nematocida TaxID=1513896 RepID=A0A1T5BM62_9SPHI|nr:outer membrane beta-barrel protein [Sphingobacterium nematocida]SKB48362.1 outer membrane protein [Sphingobacterium nematocida]